MEGEEEEDEEAIDEEYQNKLLQEVARQVHQDPNIDPTILMQRI